MPLLIGTDEAGYGPNFGPLVITATAWRLPPDTQPNDLWELLSDTVTSGQVRGDQRLHVGDSKQVYSSGRSLDALERAVHAFARHLQYPADCVGSLGTALSGSGFENDYTAIRRNIVRELTLPLENGDDECDAAAERVATALQTVNVQLLSVRSRIMFPPEFNRGVETTGSKGQVLSAATLKLVREVVDAAADPPSGWVFCDKHGGRNRYDDIIAEAFDDQFAFRMEESRASSRYRVGQLEFCFRTKAEELLPVALSSMVSKYVREVVMMQFNRFWQHHVPELKATKGYPVDALRFWEDISASAAELGIDRSEVWRCR